MNVDPGKVIVTESRCGACSTETVQVYHQSFPEMRFAGQSAEEAAERLANQLEGSLDAVSDPPHREPVRQAIADLRAFLNWEGAAHPAREL
jgi:hypothetical protein